jgi:flavorubredoxin
MEKPRRVNPDTYIVPTFFPAGHLGLLPVNWYLIEAREPILVDTGMPIEREQFLTTLGSLIDPTEIKWIFLTHDDNDHAGNLAQAMKIAPNARVVTNFLGFARLADTHELPMDRLLLINPGQSFSAGDRELTVIRPPVWDSPATHGFYDSKNRVLYAADSLGVLIPEPAEDVTDVPEAVFTEGFHTFASAVSPWLHLVDQNKFDNQLKTIRRFEPETILSSHGLVARGRTDALLKALSATPAMEPFVGPDHEQMLAIMAEVEAEGVAA